MIVPNSLHWYDVVIPTQQCVLLTVKSGKAHALISSVVRNYALITCMRLLQVCAYYIRVYAKLVYDGPAQPKHYRTTMRAFLSTAVLYTDLHAVACNLGKLNAGEKIHYTARFASYM